jgi:SAM-dependent methyltransferase
LVERDLGKTSNKTTCLDQGIYLEKNYQDYVISNGKFVGDFEGMYSNIDDPWHQSSQDHIYDSRRQISINYCNRLRSKHKVSRVVELGCGFGHLTESLRNNSFEVIGTDVSKTAVQKASALYPKAQFKQLNFNDFDNLFSLKPNILIMAEITWYVLDDLDKFLVSLKQYANQSKEPVFLIHLLATYEPGVQKYGADKFTNLDEIINYFNLEYLEYGFVKTVTEFDDKSQGTYFVAKV